MNQDHFISFKGYELCGSRGWNFYHRGNFLILWSSCHDMGDTRNIMGLSLLSFSSSTMGKLENHDVKCDILYLNLECSTIQDSHKFPAL